MISFFRRAKKEICMEFDSEGCNDLLRFFSKIKEEQSQEIRIEFDMSIIKGKYIGKIIKSVILEIDDNIDGAEISFVGDKVIWKIDEEYVDMSVERFRDCNLHKVFSPAEFMYVQVTGRKGLDYLLCDFKSIM